MKLRFIALALAALSSSAFATTSAGITTSNFTVTLKDLNTTDSVTPGLTWDQSWAMYGVSSHTVQTGYEVVHDDWGNDLNPTYANGTSSWVFGGSPAASLSGDLIGSSGSYSVSTSAGAAPVLSVQQSIEDGAFASATAQWQRGFWLTAGSQVSFSTLVDQYVKGAAYTGNWTPPSGTSSFLSHSVASTYASMSVLNAAALGSLSGGNQFIYDTGAFDNVGEGDQVKLTIRNTSGADRYYTLSFSVSTSVQAQLDPAIAAVPEPSTYALMVLGLGAVGAAARRKKA